MTDVRVRKDDGEYEVNEFTDSTGKLEVKAFTDTDGSLWTESEALGLFKASLPDGWAVEEVRNG